MATTPHILILCSANSCRSQMAEAFFRHLAGDRFTVSSAGLEPRSIHPLTVEVMREIGIDLGAQRSKSVSAFLGKRSVDLVITVCEHAERECPRLYPFCLHRLHWPFPDPALVAPSDRKAQHDAFVLTRDMIRERIEMWLRSETAGRLAAGGRR